jgi:hypothetical protein
MGGNLLTKGKRTSREKYLQIEKEIRKYLDIEIGSENYRIPRYYKTKSTFGDMDIIINAKFFDLPKLRQISFKDRLINQFGITEHKSVGNVFSTVYEGLQIDYFSVDISKLQCLTNYMDFGIGNFIGKISRRLNLKYGMYGLEYVYWASDNHFKQELTISTDTEKIFKLLDLDYNIWKKGFTDRLDAYNWLLSSKFFSTHTYLTPKPGTSKRKENRADFAHFIEWLKENNIERDVIIPSDEAKFDTIREIFPNVDIQDFIKKSENKYNSLQKFKENFNANVVNEVYPNITGKKLGIFISGFKNYIDNNYGDHKNYLINIPRNNVQNLIKNYYNNHFSK